MFKIKLKRFGKRKSFFFRIVSSDSKKGVNSYKKKFGYVDRKRKIIKMDFDKIKKEIKMGTKISKGILKVIKSIENIKIKEKYDLQIKK